MGYMLPCGLSLLLLIFESHANATTTQVIGTNNTDCSCGYYDASTKNLFTDSIIVYFNETASLNSAGFEGQTCKNPYEKGWNNQYRQGADLEHLQILNDSLSLWHFPQSLTINISTPTPDHLVMGGSIQTLRRDIHYGSFRTLLKSPRQWTGGSDCQWNSSSMRLKHSVSIC